MDEEGCHQDLYEHIRSYLRDITPAEKEKLLMTLQSIIRRELFRLNPMDSAISCPKCGCGSYVRNGHTLRGTQRYRCRDCGCTFTMLDHGEIMLYTKLDEDKWMKFAECFVDCLSCDKAAERIGVTHKTTWFMRIRTLEALCRNLPSFEVKAGCGAVLDEIYFNESFKGVSFKNLRNIPRESRDGGDSDKRGISDEKICVATGINDNGDIFYDVTCRGAMTLEVTRSVLNDRISEGSIITTDNHRSYPKVLSELNVAIHEAHPADEHEALEPIDHVHSGMKSLINHTFKGVSTKWLHLYVGYFKWIGEFAKGGVSQIRIAAKQIRSGDYDHRWRDINIMPLPFKDSGMNKVKV